jgi:hypothetical protein
VRAFFISHVKAVYVIAEANTARNRIALIPRHSQCQSGSSPVATPAAPSIKPPTSMIIALKAMGPSCSAELR